MGNVMDNHLNIERNIGGGSACNFNQKKVFGEGSPATLIKKKYSARPSPNTFYIGKAAKMGIASI